MRFFCSQSIMGALTCLLLMRISLVASFLSISSNRVQPNLFHLPIASQHIGRIPTSALLLASGGFGGSASRSKRKRGKGSKQQKPVHAPASFDVGASLLRLEKKYEEHMLADAKRLAADDVYDTSDDVVTTEYVAAARPKSITAGAATVSDWVPVAQILLARPHFLSDNDHELLCAATSFYCRELAQHAVMGSRVFASIPRNELSYALESSVSFYKHVYDNVIERDTTSENRMSNVEAKRVLGLTGTVNLDRLTLKRAYRTLSKEWHPDAVQDKTDEEQLVASQTYAQIKLAYETLLASGTLRVSGGGKENVYSPLAISSWYESLGGRERTDFVKIDQLLSIDKAQQVLKTQQVESAVIGLDPDLVQGFVARSCGRR